MIEGSGLMNSGQGSLGQRGRLLLWEELELVSLKDDSAIIRCEFQLKVNGQYRLRLPHGEGFMTVCCSAVSCVLRLNTNSSGRQIPTYEARLEFDVPIKSPPPVRELNREKAHKTRG